MRLNLPHNHHLLLGLSLSLLLSGQAEAAKPKNAILLSDVQSLTLTSTKQTTSRRVPAIPQLKCISPRKICALHTVSTMRCLNQGSSYSDQDIQWACTAPDMPTTLKLGSTEVICEGYSSADDPYVLRGSCGVEYRMVLTEEGERRFPELAGGGGGGWGGGGDGENEWAGYLFAVIFFAVLGWIVYSACVQADLNRRVMPGQQPGRRPGWGGGGGGGGGGGWGPGWGPGGGGGGGGWDDPPPPYSKSTDTGTGWRPGFWSGVAGGAAAAYMAGNRGSRQQQYDDNRGGYGSFWGGSSNRGNGGGSSSGSGSSSSIGRHESTGFGSTSRR